MGSGVCRRFVLAAMAAAMVAVAAPALAQGNETYGRMAVSAHPLASQAGMDILRRGGHAVDAAVAMQMVLTFAELQETGIGGGGFLLLEDASADRTVFYDGRETAPAAATPERFLLAGRFAMPHWAAVVSGRSVGVPGLPAMLELAHDEYGRLPWAELIQPAIDLAEAGIPMPRRLLQQLDRDPSLPWFPDLRRLVTDPAAAEPPRLRNAALAETLRQVAAGGAGVLYRGEAAEQLVRAVRGRWFLPGDLSLDDLADYMPQRRDPVCGSYRHWRICGAPPPSSGGLAILQILGMLERFDLAGLGAGSARAVHLIAEASRLAFADRQQYVGDPDFVDVPVAGLIDLDYLAGRTALIDAQRTRPRARPGEPPAVPRLDRAAPLRSDRERGTSHFSVVDGDGNAVALTSSIEAPFGARLAANGYLLNNQLTDFDFQPRRNGESAANAVAPGKRPRSSMAPTFVYDQHGELVLVVGSRGGSRIIGYVLKTLIGVLDWNLTVQQAIDLPNFLHRGDTLELEEDSPVAELAPALRELGHEVTVQRLDSGLHGMEKTGDGWRGGVDARMDGAAVGDRVRH
ncbi:MAG: gamma-glutamyltransferase [Gammaproteobacteria bacterium]|nr:gamma-glutamyltransferase [Gammaproteobacteria bacterium]